MPYMTACGAFDLPTHYSIYIYTIVRRRIKGAGKLVYALEGPYSPSPH